MVLQNYQKLLLMISNTISIVVLGGGLKCLRTTNFNTWWGGPGGLSFQIFYEDLVLFLESIKQFGLIKGYILDSIENCQLNFNTEYCGEGGAYLSRSFMRISYCFLRASINLAQVAMIPSLSASMFRRSSSNRVLNKITPSLKDVCSSFIDQKKIKNKLDYQ